MILKPPVALESRCQFPCRSRLVTTTCEIVKRKKQCQGKGRPPLEEAADKSETQDRQHQQQPQHESLQQREAGMPEVKGKEQLQDNRME